MFFGRICDEGRGITFNAVIAVVHVKDGGERCMFERNPGGVDVAKIKLKSPAGFGGQEKAAGSRTRILQDSHRLHTRHAVVHAQQLMKA